jgi:hypothetical protein
MTLRASAADAGMVQFGEEAGAYSVVGACHNCGTILLSRRQSTSALNSPDLIGRVSARQADVSAAAELITLERPLVVFHR